MPRLESELVITQSLLDRLVDHSKDKSSESTSKGDEPTTRADSFRRFKEGVKRDLEWLLNTREIPESAKGFQQLPKSLYSYGLPDISSMGIHSPRDRDRLLRMLESTIRKFEPRISNIKVHLEPVVVNTRMLRFRIEGLLRVDPAPEPVSFNTLLELTSGEYEVK